MRFGEYSIVAADAVGPLLSPEIRIPCLPSRRPRSSVVHCSWQVRPGLRLRSRPRISARSSSLPTRGPFRFSHVTSSGSSLSCSANISGDDLGYGVVDFGGRSYAKRWYAGSLVISAVSVIVPNGGGPVRVSTTFKLTGTLIAHPSSPVVDPPAPTFQYKVSGHGTVVARLSAPIGTSRDVTSYFYDFEKP